MNTTMKSFAIVALVAAASAAAFLVGSQFGEVKGRATVAEDYRLWTVGLMHRDPDLDLHAITLVRDGELIKKPECNSPTQPYLRLSRRPDEYSVDLAQIIDVSEKDSWAAKIPSGGSKAPPVAAAVVGCYRKKLPASS